MCQYLPAPCNCAKNGKSSKMATIVKDVKVGGKYEWLHFSFDPFLPDFPGVHSVAFPKQDDKFVDFLVDDVSKSSIPHKPIK